MWQSRGVSPTKNRSPNSGASWQDVPLSPLTLVRGTEGLLVDRTVDRLRKLAREQDPELELVQLSAATYTGGQLATVTSPSLFAEARFVILDDLETISDPLPQDLVAYLSAPPSDVWLVAVHHGGVRGKKTLDGLRAAGAVEVVCDPVKRDNDKAAFVSAEFAAAQRKIAGPAVQALVEALGSDLRELAAACSQLITDTTGNVDVATVNTYYGGRVEASGFAVADAAIAGDGPKAIASLRHALATGTDPVPLVAALAMKLRTLAKVGAMRSNPNLNASSLGLAPWQVDKARRELQRWTPNGLARAIQAVAQADADVKGQSRDPHYAVERAVLAIVQASGQESVKA